MNFINKTPSLRRKLNLDYYKYSLKALKYGKSESIFKSLDFFLISLKQQQIV